ncbi:addiction module protein [bacterium]|nr:addiction module protein [bacterium]
MENSKTLLKKALLLKPQERFKLVDGLIRSLDEPNKEIDEIWLQESQKRLQAHREGKTKGIPFEQIFKEEQNE